MQITLSTARQLAEMWRQSSLLHFMDNCHLRSGHWGQFAVTSPRIISLKIIPAYAPLTNYHKICWIRAQQMLAHPLLDCKLNQISASSENVVGGGWMGRGCGSNKWNGFSKYAHHITSRSIHPASQPTDIIHIL